MQLCKCGCGESKPELRSRGRKSGDYISGHNSYGKFNELSPNWKGGRIKQSVHGKEYWLVKCDGHHRADKKGYVLEHILKMEKYLGGPLTKDEVVHHVNGNGLDNRMENLELFANNAEHMKYHASKWKRKNGRFMGSKVS